MSLQVIDLLGKYQLIPQVAIADPDTEHCIDWGRPELLNAYCPNCVSIILINDYELIMGLSILCPM